MKKRRSSKKRENSVLNKQPTALVANLNYQTYYKPTKEQANEVPRLLLLHCQQRAIGRAPMIIKKKANKKRNSKKLCDRNWQRS